MHGHRWSGIQIIEEPEGKYIKPFSQKNIPFMHLWVEIGKYNRSFNEEIQLRVYAIVQNKKVLSTSKSNLLKAKYIYK